MTYEETARFLNQFIVIYFPTAAAFKVFALILNKANHIVNRIA